MANILYLVHRLPYPPNKGDKVRSYHLLKHLVARHRVFLGTFVDDPDDMVHLDTLRKLCADVHAIPLQPRRARVASLLALLTGGALTERYYRDERLHSWVQRTVAAEAIDAMVVFSSSMVQYAQRSPAVPMLVDLVDVDSAKWRDYAQAHRWPMSWVYRREARLLLEVERRAVAASAAAYLVTAKEVALFNQLAPEAGGRVRALGNGVDTSYFAPDAARPSPFVGDGKVVVFTGAMDYWPNVDAVTWFAQTALPVLRETWPTLCLHIVGRSPSSAVMALAGSAVVVTGTVADVRPYLQHADVVVAPLRLARGVQNKVLEALAMARPVVAAQTCVDAIDVRADTQLLAAEAAGDRLLRDPTEAARIGRAGRQRMLDVYSWEAQLAALDPALEPMGAPTANPHHAMRVALS
jgi:polysaccharide biosynthesis protein PslH